MRNTYIWLGFAIALAAVVGFVSLPSMSVPAYAGQSEMDDGTQDGSNTGVYARRYSAAGVAQGDEFQVNTYTTNRQADPVAAMDASGGFVIAWRGEGDEDDAGIYAQRFDASGATLGGQIPVNRYTDNTQAAPAVAMDGDGDFVVAWESLGQDGSQGGIFAQRFDAAGDPLGDWFQVNSYTFGQQRLPEVAMDVDGDFGVVWQSDGQSDDEGYGVYAQVYRGRGCYADPLEVGYFHVADGDWLDCVSYSRIDAGPFTVEPGGTLVLTSPATALGPGSRVDAGGVLKAGP